MQLMGQGILDLVLVLIQTCTSSRHRSPQTRTLPAPPVITNAELFWFRVNLAQCRQGLGLRSKYVFEVPSQKQISSRDSWPCYMVHPRITSPYWMPP